MTKIKKVAKPTQTKMKRTTAKKATVAAKNVDSTQKKEVVKQVVESKREIKYNYPNDCKAPLDRKAFRQKTRAAIKKIENKIFKAKSDKIKNQLEKELKTLKAEVLL